MNNMVNYCCVYGCGRNSRQSSHLNYYSLPKEKERMIQWLALAGRNDLIKKIEDNVAVSQRICSRHFPNSAVKNRNLIADALPSLCLPGKEEEDSTSSTATTAKVKSHDSIICNNCSNLILHFRYKCVTCKDFDLCPKCEMREVHSEHFMLRIPRALKSKHIKTLEKYWKKYFKDNHITPDSGDSCSDSDDDEPIVKYAKTYDSGVDLSEDVKAHIKNVVHSCLNIKEEPKVKRMKLKLPEVVFADVNDVKQEYISLSDTDVEEVDVVEASSSKNMQPVVKLHVE